MLTPRRAGIVAAVVVPAILVALPASAALRKTSTTTSTTTTTTTTAPTTAAPSGQTTAGGLLSGDDVSFGTGLGGWGSLSGAGTAWAADQGRSAAGSLVMTSAGAYTGALSPTFAVVPGARYVASAWVRAASTGHSVAAAVRFRDSSGALIAAGTQVGQYGTDDPTQWLQTSLVVGFAPANAVSGEVAVFGTDATTGLDDYVDDVSVTQTTGVAAPLAAPLKTVGSAVVDGLGRQVSLHSIQLAGLSRATWSATTITTDEIAQAQSWGANAVRIELAENPMVSSDCAYDPAYVAIVDSVVSDVTSRGMLALLDLHTNALTPCGAMVQQKMPDAESVGFWKFVAARYKNNPLVAFDLYNEPHDVTDAQWHSGGSLTSNGTAYTAVGMQKLYNTVRSTGATNLVVASGKAWANAYPATAPITSPTNLVYGVHAYTCPSATPAKGGSCNPGPAGVYDPSGILDGWTSVTAPVWVTEFGWPSAYDGKYASNVISYATSHNWVGWNIFAFDGTNAGTFDLVKDTGPIGDPMPAGMPAILGMLSD